MYLQKAKNTSGYAGVSLAGVGYGISWWSARVTVQGKKIQVGGSYATKEAAARAYDRALIAALGRGQTGTRAGYNFPLESYPERVRCMAPSTVRALR